MFGYGYFNRGFFSIHYWGTWSTYPYATAEPDNSVARRRLQRRYFIR